MGIRKIGITLYKPQLYLMFQLLICIGRWLHSTQCHGNPQGTLPHPFQGHSLGRTD